MPVLNPDKSPAIATTAKRPPKPGPGYQWIGGQWLLYDPVVAPLPPNIYQDPVSSPWEPTNIPGTGAWQDEVGRIGDMGVDTGTIFGPGAPANSGEVNRPTDPGRPDWLDIEGRNPDLNAAVLGDPDYLLGFGGIGKQRAAAFAKQLETIRGLAVRYGGKGIESLLGRNLLTQETLNQAQANPFSTMAELGRTLDRGGRQASASLAGRGLLRSGALPALQAKLQEDYARGEAGASEAFLSGVNEATGEYATGEADRGLQEINLKSQIRDRLAKLPEYQAYAPGRATWDASYGAYRTADGRLYDQNKTLIGVV